MIVRAPADQRRSAGGGKMMLTLFHGTVGYLDELLALGIVIAIGAVIYLIFAMVESRSHSSKDRHEEQ